MKKLLWPALSVFALVAVASCGDDPDAAGPPVLVLAPNGGDSGASPTADAANESMVGEKMMWGYQMHFSAAVDLPALDTDAPSYVMSAGEVSPDSLNTLKAVFGVTEEFVAQDETMGGGYLAGTYDGTTAVLYVGSDPMHYWSYSPKWDQSTISSRPCVSEPVATADSPVTSDSGTSDSVTSDSGAPLDPAAPTTAPVGGICEEPIAPENVPSETEAEALFVATLSDLGVDSDQLLIDTYADEWGATVTGFLEIDGVRSSLSWSIGYGADAAIVWAGGIFADVQPGATYPRIGTAAALERLNNEQGGGAWGRYAPSDGNVAIEDQAMPPVSDSVSGDSATSEVVGDPVPVPETGVPLTDVPATDVPEIEIQEVSIVAVEEELVTLYGADGSIYLVPGYSFVVAEDEYGYSGRYTVSALPDEYMQTADAVVIESGEPGVTEPVPDTAVASTGGSSGAGSEPTAITQEAADTLVGLSESEAVEAAVGNGWQARIGSRDGEDFALTMDYRFDRVTLTIVGDKVTAVSVG